MVYMLVRNVTREQFTICAILLGMAVLFLLPALDNGFPFVYPDTGDYLGGSGLSHIRPDRPMYYAWFTRLFDLPILVPSSTSQTPWNLKGWSPWPSVVLQSLITAWVIWRFASTLFRLTAAFRLLFLALLLVLGTSLPWLVGQIMPDIFTPLMILALALLCFTKDMLPRPSGIILVLLIGTAVAFHQANLLVALWMLPALGLCALLGWRPSKPFLRGLFASGIGLTLGVVALVTMNLVSGRFGLSSGGSVFLLARFMEDGTALSYLEKACPKRRFSVCAYLDELRSFRPTMITLPGCGSAQTVFNNYFIWEGPLERLGGFRAEESEASAIVAGTLSAYPLAQFRASVNNGLRQLFSFRTGEGLCAYPETSSWSMTIDTIFGPVVYDHYLKSKQIRDALRLEFLNYIHAAVLVASSLVLIGFLVVRGPRKQPLAFFASLSVIVLVAGNAFTLGVLSGVGDRYQSRVVWLVPVLAACIVLARLPYFWHRNRPPASVAFSRFQPSDPR
jgi:hypothetical protein